MGCCGGGWLVSGGVGALGSLISGWLAASGLASRLCLLGRSGRVQGPPALQLEPLLAASGCAVTLSRWGLRSAARMHLAQLLQCSALGSATFLEPARRATSQQAARGLSLQPLLLQNRAVPPARLQSAEADNRNVSSPPPLSRSAVRRRCLQERCSAGEAASSKLRLFLQSLQQCTPPGSFLPQQQTCGRAVRALRRMPSLPFAQV